jgi:hypothetical protein
VSQTGRNRRKKDPTKKRGILSRVDGDDLHDDGSALALALDLARHDDLWFRCCANSVDSRSVAGGWQLVVHTEEQRAGSLQAARPHEKLGLVVVAAENENLRKRSRFAPCIPKEIVEPMRCTLLPLLGSKTLCDNSTNSPLGRYHTPFDIE